VDQIDDFTDRDLQAMVRWIESDTLLRSREDLIAEVMAELGFERRGKKIVSRISAAIDAVRAQPTGLTPASDPCTPLLARSPTSLRALGYDERRLQDWLTARRATSRAPTPPR
jgi:hypothetical protein